MTPDGSWPPMILSLLVRRFPIGVQIAAAHAGSLDFDDDLMRARRRIRKAFQGDTAVSLENHTEHSSILSK